MTLYIIGCCFMCGIMLYEMRDDKRESFMDTIVLWLIVVLWPLTLGCYVAWICESVRQPKDEKEST